MSLSEFLKTISILKDEESLSLDCLTCVDYKTHIDIVYHFFSRSKKEFKILNVTLPLNHLTVPTMTHLWPNADWYEREIFDLFGVSFEGHPNLKRLLLEDTWPNHPLRKKI